MATNPQAAASPLPTPPPAPGAFALLLRAAQGAAPTNSPDVNTAIAQASSNPGDAATSAQAYAGYSSAAEAVTALQGYSVKQQQQIYDNAPASEQTMLSTAGYKRPGGGGGGWGLGRIMHDIEHNPLTDNPVTRFAERGLGDVMSARPVADVANAFNAGIRFSTHVARTAYEATGERVYNPAMPGMEGLPWESSAKPMTISALMNAPSQIARAWDETSNGTKFISPHVLAEAQTKYSPQVYQLGYAQATGQTPDQILAATPDADKQQVYALLQSGQVADATRFINDGHVSPGRALVGQHFLYEHQALGNLMSGSIDGLYDMVADPTIVAGKVGKGLDVMRFIAQSSQDVRDVYYATNEANRFGRGLANRVSDLSQRAYTRLGGTGQIGFRGAVDNIAARIGSQGTDATAGLIKDYPQLEPVIPTMVHQGLDTPTKVLDYFADDMMGSAAIIQGNPAHVIGLQGGILPHLSWAGQSRLATKLMKGIDFAADADRTTIFDGVKPEDVLEHALNPDNLTQIEAGKSLKYWTLRKTGMSVRRLATLVSEKDDFNPYDSRALSQLRNRAMTALSADRADQYVNAFAATRDLGLKQKIWDGLQMELGHAAGFPEDMDQWARYQEQYLSTGEKNIASHRPKFAPGTIDGVETNGHANPEPILEKDPGDIRFLAAPFRDMYITSKRGGLLRALGTPFNTDFANKSMAWWRGLTLARPAFALRVASEEALGFILREGPGAYVASRASVSYGKRLMKQAAEEAADDPNVEVGGAYERLMNTIPRRFRSQIRTPTDLAKHWLAARTTAAMKGIAGALSHPEYVRRLEDYVRYGGQESFNRGISAIENHYDDIRTPRSMMNAKAGKVVPTEIVAQDAGQNYARHANLYDQMFRKRLWDIARSPWARTSMLNADAPMLDRINAVADHLQSNPEFWSQFRRSQGTRDGKLVGTQRATGAPLVGGMRPPGNWTTVSERDAAMDHAHAINQLVDSLIRSPDGSHLQVDGKNMVDHLLDNWEPPSLAKLHTIPEDQLPEQVHGPHYARLADDSGPIEKLTNKLFQRVIGPQIDWIAREPMFLHHYVMSRRAFDGWTEKYVGQMGEASRSNVEQMAHEAAMQRAANATTPFIHNPHLRSQFSVITRNLMPFWFAQEQFYKRWARTFYVAPWSIRQAQLLNQGFAHTGFVHTDPETGQKYFVYPGSGAVLDVINKTFGQLGQKVSIPLEAAFTGQVSALNPGLERIGLPNVGPFMQVPMNFIAMIDPHMAGAITKLEGNTAAPQGNWQKFVAPFFPADVNRAFQFADPSFFEAPQYASAVMQAIQQVEASGHGIGEPATNYLGQTAGVGPPPPGGQMIGDYVTDAAGKTYVLQADGKWRSPDDLDAYYKRVAHAARTVMMMRALFGFAAPASPNVQFGPAVQLNKDLQEAFGAASSPSEAYNMFLQAHPDATAFTVAKTQVDQGYSSTPETASAMKFLDTHSAFMNDHTLAGSFFIPQADSKDPFSMAAYQEQLADGMRQRKDPHQFYNDVVTHMSQRIYYDSVDRKNAMMANPPAGQDANAIKQAWTAWEQQFMLANPVFATELQSNTATLKRAQIMSDVGNALRDPRLPDSDQTENIRTLYNAWQIWQMQVHPTAGTDAAHLTSAAKSQLDQDFAIRAQQFVTEHPDVLDLYNTAIRPSLTAVIDQLAAQGVTA